MGVEAHCKSNTELSIERSLWTTNFEIEAPAIEGPITARSCISFTLAIRTELLNAGDPHIAAVCPKE